MSQENVEVVRRLIEHWQEGDWRWGRDIFDDQCEAVFSASWFPEADHYRVGADALRAQQDHRCRRSGRRVDSPSARGQASGAAVDALTGGIFTLRGGKIVRYVLTDAREALEAVGLRE
jgi:hypothetical protein